MESRLANGLIIPEGVDPEDLDTIVLRPTKNGVLVFRCPLCGNTARSEYAGLEPCCTGPHPSLDEHPMEVMVRVTE